MASAIIGMQAQATKAVLLQSSHKPEREPAAAKPRHHKRRRHHSSTEAPLVVVCNTLICQKIAKRLKLASVVGEENKRWSIKQVKFGGNTNVFHFELTMDVGLDRKGASLSGLIVSKTVAPHCMLRIYDKYHKYTKLAGC
jgi:hypothetical protein